MSYFALAIFLSIAITLALAIVDRPETRNKEILIGLTLGFLWPLTFIVFVFAVFLWCLIILAEAIFD